MPGTIDANGIAVAFAVDGVEHRVAAVTLAEMIWSGQFRAWVSAAYPFHLKPYSISFAIFGPFLGFSILGAEPLNLSCYLGILIFVYKLGNEIFGARVGLVAAGMVGLWPSFLLHTTQLLRDPLFILGMLALIFVMTGLLLHPYLWRKSLLHGVMGGLLAALLWKIRSDMAPVLMATVILGALMVVIRQLALGHLLVANVAGIAFLAALTAGAMFLPVYREADRPRRYREALTQATPVMREEELSVWQLATRIAIVRQRFITMYPDSRANIDTDVRLATDRDLLRYLPRAMAIGLFAPFPNMWFETGSSVGSVGRVLSGFETLIMYAIECLAMIALWRGRRQLSFWLLTSIILMGTIALGLVVVNVGTLYRLRYLFLMLMIILAAGSITHYLDCFMRRRITDVLREAGKDC
ncbi:MAG: hypothetical protein ABJB61_06965 [bacterium]